MLAGASAFAQQYSIGRTPLGSGEPGKPGVENATQVDNNVYHAPQYLPGYPTAATIWPRAVEVNCMPDGGRQVCEPYQWTPALGRGEYLYFTPILISAAPAPAPTVTPPPTIIYRDKPPARKDRN